MTGGRVDRIINLLAHINSEYRRCLLFILPTLTIIISVYNLYGAVPTSLYFAGNTAVIAVVITTLCVYRVSQRKDLFCVAASINFFILSITSFLVSRVHEFILYGLYAMIAVVFIIMILVRFSPRRYG